MQPHGDDDWRQQQEQERDQIRMVHEAEDALRRAVDLGLSGEDVLAIERVTQFQLRRKA